MPWDIPVKYAPGLFSILESISQELNPSIAEPVQRRAPTITISKSHAEMKAVSRHFVNKKCLQACDAIWVDDVMRHVIKLLGLPFLVFVRPLTSPAPALGQDYAAHAFPLVRACAGSQHRRAHSRHFQQGGIREWQERIHKVPGTLVRPLQELEACLGHACRRACRLHERADCGRGLHGGGRTAL